MSYRHRPSSRRGQSIVEAIISIGLLTGGFLGIFTLLSRSFFLSRITADELTATYLASEGVEIVKNLIDHDIYKPGGAGWGSCCSPGFYRVDYNSKNLTNYPNPVSSPVYLNFDPTNHTFDYSGPKNSNFNRWIEVSWPNANEIMVVVRVAWATGITSQNLSLEDHFYNWHP